MAISGRINVRPHFKHVSEEPRRNQGAAPIGDNLSEASSPQKDDRMEGQMNALRAGQQEILHRLEQVLALLKEGAHGAQFRPHPPADVAASDIEVWNRAATRDANVLDHSQQECSMFDQTAEEACKSCGAAVAHSDGFTTQCDEDFLNVSTVAGRAAAKVGQLIVLGQCDFAKPVDAAHLRPVDAEPSIAHHEADKSQYDSLDDAGADGADSTHGVQRACEASDAGVRSDFSHDAEVLRLSGAHMLQGDWKAKGISSAAAIKDLFSETSVLECPQAQRHLSREGRRSVLSLSSEQPLRKKSFLSSLRDYLKEDLKPLHPDCWVRVVIDCVSAMLLLYDAVLVPYSLAWESETMFQRIVFYFGLSFWTTDLALTFATGYYGEDDLVMDWVSIAIRYIRRTFLMDVVVVSLDWLTFFMERRRDGESSGGESILRILRFAKANRFLRLAAMLQSGRFSLLYDRAITYLQKYGAHNYFKVTMSLLKMVFLILWMNHLGCCMWYVIGQDPTRTGRGWMASFDESYEFSEEEKYVVGFYWSISTMVSAVSYMTPENTGEFAFATCYGLFGLLFGSSLISSLAAMLMEFKQSQQETKHKLKLLGDFLAQRQIETGLALRIHRQIAERLAIDRQLTESDVECVELLSSSMRTKLRFQLYAHHLSSDPLWRTISSLPWCGIEFITHFIETGLRSEVYHPGSVIFDKGEDARGTFFVAMGSLEYTTKEDVSNHHQNGKRDSHLTDGAALLERKTCARHTAYDRTSRSTQDGIAASRRTTTHGRASMKLDDWLSKYRSPSDKEGTVVSKGHWLCKAALWMYWQYKGLLETRSHTELLFLSNVGLKRSMREFPDLKALVKPYGEMVAKLVTSYMSAGVDDVKFPIEHDMVLHGLPSEVRHQLSMPVLDHVRRQAKFQVKNKFLMAQRIEELERDILDNKIDLVCEPAGQFRCIIQVAVLCIARPDESTILVQLGHLTPSADTASPMHVDAHFDVPGTRVRPHESPSDAIQRLLASTYPGLHDYLTWGEKMEPRVEYLHTHSARLDMTVTSVRYVFRATFVEGFKSMLMSLKLPVHSACAGDPNLRWSPSSTAFGFGLPRLRRANAKDGLMRPSDSHKGDVSFPHEIDNAYALAIGSSHVAVASFFHEDDLEKIIGDPICQRMQGNAIAQWLADEVVQQEIREVRRLVCL